ncbi:MAG: tetratricopeptide repeat protein [Myxococcaceae bacterium]|jgi:tetratricopeptide (TPR) repeat protein|nr:tetratricopeptide repeat protein [Myxococcaceae bacterium]
MVRILLLALLLCVACTPRVAMTVRAPARVALGPVKKVSILTHEGRIGQVMRERARYELSADGYFTVVKLCGTSSCEPVDAFVRLYELEVRAGLVAHGSRQVPMMHVAVETDVVSGDGRPLTPKRIRTRQAELGPTPGQTMAERLATELAHEAIAELLPPKSTQWLVFEDAAPFQLGIKQALDGRLEAARKTFQDMIDANPKTAGAWFNLGIVLELQGEPAAAKEHYVKAIALANKPEYGEMLEAFEKRQAVLRQVEAPPSR